MAPKSITVGEIMKHSSENDLWTVVNGHVYDLTEFAPEHPGGSAIILKYAGRDATAAYSEIHAPSLIITSLPPSKHIGALETSSITPDWLQLPPSIVTATAKSALSKPPLSSLISTHDFREIASKTLTPKTWAFYSSAATDCLTHGRNNSMYNEIGLRPRIMINVKEVDTTTEMLGARMSVPIFCAPAAMAKMVHETGEKGLARGCQKQGIPECVSTNASFPLREIVGSTDKSKDMDFFFQLYVDKNRSKSEKLIDEAEELGVKGIFVTVDTPVPGKREADERVKADESLTTPMSGVKAKNDAKGGSLGRIMGRYIDPSLSWDDIPWLRKCTKLPIVLKGVMTWMDAKKAMEFGIDGIVLSNHGGRNLDTSPAPILVLLELQRNCPEIFDQMEVYVDGGILRGTDIFKALCLGAKAVGIGRGLLFALNYGEEGVEKFISILKDELETTMRLCGITNLAQVHPGLVNTQAVDHLIPIGGDHPYAKWRLSSRLGKFRSRL